MPEDEGRTIDLVDETRLNVASLLLEPVGSTRTISLAVGRFPLDEELVANNVTGDVRLTRLRDQILANGKVNGHVTLECARCLTEYDQPFTIELTEQFTQTVDVRSGATLSNGRRPQTGDEPDDDEPGFEIDESHELNLGEALRQWIVLSLPMQPSCGEQCPGPVITSTGDDEQGDERFAELAKLLDDEQR